MTEVRYVGDYTLAVKVEKKRKDFRRDSKYVFSARWEIWQRGGDRPALVETGSSRTRFGSKKKAVECGFSLAEKHLPWDALEGE